MSVTRPQRRKKYRADEKEVLHDVENAEEQLSGVSSGSSRGIESAAVAQQLLRPILVPSIFVRFGS
jgi:hypothetical protein